MSSKWISLPRNDGTATTRLLALAHTGGGASAFHSWGNQLTSEISVCPVTLPGREFRMGEEPETDLARLVELLTPEVAKLSGKPYVIFGHSLGALIGFELVHRLAELGAHLPKKLMVAACGAPGGSQRAAGSRPSSELADGEFLGHLKKENALPPSMLASAELLPLVLPLLRADFNMLESYQAKARDPLDCSIVTYSGKADSNCGLEQMAAWNKETRRSCLSRSYGGGHFFVQSHKEKFLADLECDILDL